jgi:hypothetical protein
MESDPKIDLPSQPASVKAGVTKPILWIAAVPALAIAYYFGIALPADNAARLELERQQHRYAQEAAAQLQERLDSCFTEADTSYWNYMKLNGEELQDGKISAPVSVWDTAEARKNYARETCLQRYPQRPVR